MNIHHTCSLEIKNNSREDNKDIPTKENGIQSKNKKMKSSPHHSLLSICENQRINVDEPKDKIRIHSGISQHKIDLYCLIQKLEKKS